ncbi:MAG: hypothetical protein AAF511_00585 [Pseudomonadota bacterium]
MRAIVSFLAAAVAAIVLTACSHSPSPMQICSSSSLAEERSSTMTAVNGAERRASQSGQTVLSEKLQSYSARFEIAHRSMVSSCQLYANCLDTNGGKETKCLRSESRLDAAQSEYYGMLREFDRLQMEVSKTCCQTERQEGPAHRNPDNNNTPTPGCNPNCATTQNVFTTDCCPLPSS